MYYLRVDVSLPFLCSQSGVNIVYFLQYPGWTLTPVGSLFMTTVNDDTAGVYTCTPYNSYGSMGSSEATNVILQVSVHSKPTKPNYSTCTFHKLQLQLSKTCTDIILVRDIKSLKWCQPGYITTVSVFLVLLNCHSTPPCVYINKPKLHPSQRIKKT